MAGRCADMHAVPTARSGWPHRERLGLSTRVCLVAGVLCALGVISAAVLHTGEHAHHRLPALAAVVAVADTHGAQLRGDQPAVQSARVMLTDPSRPAATIVSAVAAPGLAAVETVRTRGPPGTAA